MRPRSDNDAPLILTSCSRQSSLFRLSPNASAQSSGMRHPVRVMDESCQAVNRSWAIQGQSAAPLLPEDARRLRACDAEAVAPVPKSTCRSLKLSRRPILAESPLMSSAVLVTEERERIIRRRVGQSSIRPSTSAAIIAFSSRITVSSLISAMAYPRDESTTCPENSS